MACPRFAVVPPSKDAEGAGKAGRALHPRSRVQNCTKNCTRAYRSSGGIPAFPAQWFYGFLRALPGDRLSCHRRRADRSTRLDASIGASGPHDFAVRRSALSSAAPPSSTASHRAFRDDREPPLLSGETGGFKSLICPTAEAEYFFGEDWTAQISLKWFGKFDFVRRPDGRDLRRSDGGLHLPEQRSSRYRLRSENRQVPAASQPSSYTGCRI